jgi:outer membrane protein insertion porin family
MKRRIVLGILLVVATGCGKTENSLLLLDKLPDVEAIDFQGNKAFSDGTLKELMILTAGTWWNPFEDHKYRAGQLPTDVNAILTYYLRHGYLRAQVDPMTRESKGKITITFVIQEGEAFTVKDVSIRGVPGEMTKKLQKNLTLKAGAPMDPFLVSQDRETMVNELADLGYWEAQVDATVQYFGNRGLVFYQIQLGSMDTLQKLIISNTQRLKQQVVRRDISSREGEVLYRKELVKSQTRLLQSGYYYDARWDTTGLDTTAHRLDVNFRVRERPVHWIEGGVGLSSTSQLRVSGEWGTRNFLRTGTRFAINTQTDFDIAGRLPGPLDEHRTDLIWNIRRIFGTSFEGQPNAYYRYDNQIVVTTPPAQSPTYSQDFVGVGFNARLKFGDLRNQLVFSVDNQWIWNHADSAAQASDPQLTRESYTQRTLTGWVERDTRNSFFNPTHGNYHYALGQLAGGAQGGASGFRKVDGSEILIRRLPVKKLVLAGRLQLGYIWPTSTDSLVAGKPISGKAELVPTQDRFILGGGTSVRGYQQDELNGIAPGDSSLAGGGLSQLLANIEFRAPLFWKLGVVGFLDMGNVWQNPAFLDLGDFVPHADRSKVGTDDVRYTYGLGLRLDTPVGPFRVDYAWKWNYPQDPPGQPQSRRSGWHVGIGQAF